MKHAIILLLTIFITSCTAIGPMRTYIPPTISEGNAYSATLNKTYDKAWEDLINYLSVSSFAIDNFEKDSGLVTLSFGAGRITEYVDCGTMDGTNYIDFLKLGNYRVSFTGKMNISLREIDEETSSLRVNARYILSDGFSTYAFDSGSSDSENASNPANGTIAKRICAPTYLAEKTLIDYVESL